MKLTSQEEYGLRCILNLARRNEADDRETGEGENSQPQEKTSLTVGRIAEDEGLSTEYAAKLMGVLCRAGLVESVRGRNGGYRLSRSPDEVSVSEALAALGGKLYEDETCDRFSGDHSLCVHTNACSIRSLWSVIQRIIDQVLSQTTLGDMVRTGERGLAHFLQQRTEDSNGFEIPEELPEETADGYPVGIPSDTPGGTSSWPPIRERS